MKFSLTSKQTVVDEISQCTFWFLNFFQIIETKDACNTLIIIISKTSTKIKHLSTSDLIFFVMHKLAVALFCDIYNTCIYTTHACILFVIK